MKETFSRYQIFVIGILAFLQFTIILDFMVLSPLGVIILEELKITTAEFGIVVSAYAFSAGASALLTAGFADRFDRKKTLLFFYVGFLLGTVFCAIAPTYEFLLGARIITGIFGGVIGAISYAIIADLFPLEMRGRVMGFVMASFAASQVLGLPLSLYLTEIWDWHASFWMIAGVGAVVGVFMLVFLKPIDAHLEQQTEKRPFRHLIQTATRGRYIWGFSASILLATGGYMLMPFGSTFGVNNLGVPFEQLPLVYMATGLVTIVAGPLLGKFSDSMGKYFIFTLGSLLTIVMVVLYTNLGLTPLWLVIVINSILFVGITARMISANALITAVPDLKDRGAFMSINSAMQQLAGGVASLAAGMIVYQKPSGEMVNYPLLGLVVSGTMLITLILMFRVNSQVEPDSVAEPDLPVEPVVD